MMKSSLYIDIAVSMMLAVATTACDSLSSSHVSQQTVTLTAAASGDAPGINAEVRVLDWDDLIPNDFSFENLLQDYDIAELSDDDPRAVELFDKLMTRWQDAPVVEALDGQTVRLPGFVVPLDGDGHSVEEFLLVPYYGACIHVPPPPANQTVHVLARGQGYQVRRLFDTVWVTGVIRVEHTSSELAESGYQLDAIEVAPYDG